MQQSLLQIPVEEQRKNLSEDQIYALQRFSQGANLFVTGPAGTGKSFLIDEMVQNAAMRSKTIQVCAMTGVAAVLLGRRARTIHSWAGVRLCQDEPLVTAQKVAKQAKNKKAWRQTDILVVDEVSMMSDHVFDTLNATAQTCRNILTRQFGGMQLVFVGDMFQLPPVGNSVKPCFQSADWFKTFDLQDHVELRHIFRQTDPEYVRVLMQVREGRLEPDSAEILQRRVGQTPAADKILTQFFPKRALVDKMNRDEFANLRDPKHTYPVVECTTMKTYADSGQPIVPVNRLSKQDQEWELQNLKAHAQLDALTLKVGAVVMCTSNISLETGIVNGSQGRVVEFTASQMVKVFDVFQPMNLPVVLFNNGQRMPMAPKVWQSSSEPTVAVSQIPLQLSWAMTIHKSQGATMDAARMDLGNDVFEYGQAYVALSRVKTLDGLYLHSFNPAKIKANPNVLQFYEKMRGAVRQTVTEADLSKATVSKTTDFSRFNHTPVGVQETELKSAEEKPQAAKRWTLEEDVFLVGNKDRMTTDELAAHFNKTKTGIKSRIKHVLDEPEHAAYIRYNKHVESNASDIKRVTW